MTDNFAGVSGAADVCDTDEPKAVQRGIGLGTNIAMPLDEGERSEALASIAHYVGSYQVGDVVNYRKPFTAQYRQALRDNYPEEKEQFDKIDKVVGGVTTLYRKLRIKTAVMLFIFLFASVFGCWGLEHSPLHASLGSWFYWVEFGLISGLWAIAAFMRQAWRREVLNIELGNLTAGIAEEICHRINDVISKMKSICVALSTFDEQTPSTGWADRGKDLCKMALWHADRAQGLDHYSTTVFWKIRTTLTWDECFSRLGKGLMLVVALVVLLAIHSSGRNISYDCWATVSIAGCLLWTVIWGVYFFRDPSKPHPHRIRGLMILAAAFAALGGIWARQAGESWGIVAIGALLIAGSWWPWITNAHDNNKLGNEFAKALQSNLPKGSSPACHYDAISDALARLIATIVVFRTRTL